MKILNLFAKSKKQRTPVLSWHNVFVHNYFLSHVCLALEEVGFFEYLRLGQKSIPETARDLKIREDFLKLTVEYLYSVTNFLGKNGDNYYLKDQNFYKNLYLLLAYDPVFANLSELLKEEKKYSIDLVRNGYYLQKASDLFSGEALKTVLSILDNESDGQLVDFGCGSAGALIKYCHKLSRRGIGIDVDSDVIRAAKNNISKAGLGDKISLVEADVLRIENWKRYVSVNNNYFIASTILHEFLRNGENYVIEFLKALKLNFPGSRFFIIEFDAIPFGKMREVENVERRFFAAMYQFWHPLTNQGMPQPREVWERMVGTSGCKLKNVIRVKNDLLIYDCTL